MMGADGGARRRAREPRLALMQIIDIGAIAY
jgi:hypothetical protein